MKEEAYQIENKDKITFRQWQEKDKLTLRKNQIFDKLFTKRKTQYIKEEESKNKYNINISTFSKNQEIIENPELYLKTKFDIKNWFVYLFSKNVNEIKQALYLIDLFVKLQLREIPFEKRALSRNNYELINCLCHYLNHTDKQIDYYACRIITNLINFPSHIEKLIYTEKNINEIITFINNNDFDLGYEFIGFLINLCLNSDVRKFFVDNKILEKITYLIKNNLDKLENKHHYYLIKLLSIIIRLFDESNEYSKEQKKNWFRPLLPFYKNTLKNNYVNNPWYSKNEGGTYITLLLFYSKLSNDDVEFIKEIINNDYIPVLIEFYYKLEEKHLVDMMKIFSDLLAYDDSINQSFINEGFLGLLINEINRIENKNDNLLNTILIVCSNISCGPQGQIEQLFGQGILWKTIDIAYYYISQNSFTKIINDIIYNAIYTLNESIIGGANGIRVELMLYQEFIIVNIYYFILKNNFVKDNEDHFLQEVGKAIYKLIVCGESELDIGILNKFRNKLISVGMEEVVNNIIFSYEEKDIQLFYTLILQFIQEADI